MGTALRAAECAPGDHRWRRCPLGSLRASREENLHHRADRSRLGRDQALGGLGVEYLRPRCRRGAPSGCRGPGSGRSSGRDGRGGGGWRSAGTSRRPCRWWWRGPWRGSLGPLCGGMSWVGIRRRQARGRSLGRRCPHAHIRRNGDGYSGGRKPIRLSRSETARASFFCSRLGPAADAASLKGASARSSPISTRDLAAASDTERSASRFESGSTAARDRRSPRPMAAWIRVALSVSERAWSSGGTALSSPVLRRPYAATRLSEGSGSCSRIGERIGIIAGSVAPNPVLALPAPGFILAMYVEAFLRSPREDAGSLT